MQQLVLGRRLLAKIATAWAVDSNGHVAVQFASAPFSAASVASDPAVPSDSIPESVLWVAMVLGLFLLYGATWWVSFLADTLRVGYRPEPGSLGSVDAEEGIVPRRKDVYVAAVSLVLIIALHALAGVYSGQGTLADASLEQSMRSFTLSYWICTIVIGALFLPVMVLELSRNTRVMRSRHRYVSLQLYAILFGALVTRGLLASLLVAAGTTFLQDFVTILMLLIFVLFPTLYATLLLSSYVFSGRRLYMPDTPATNPGRDRYGVERVLTLFSLAVMLGVSVVLGVTIPVWLISPFLQSRNGAYTNQAIIATELMTMAIPFFGISFALSESGKRLLRGAMRKIGSSIGQGKKGV
jgi:hypothetical protein